MEILGINLIAWVLGTIGGIILSFGRSSEIA